MKNYQQKIAKSTRAFDQGDLAPIFDSVGKLQTKDVKRMLVAARESGSQGYSLVGHLYHTNLYGYLMFWLFTVGLMQYDFSLASDIHSVETGKVREPHNFSLPKAKQILANTLKINNVQSIVQLMLSLRSSVIYALDFAVWMHKNRYGGTYHQLNDMKTMVSVDYGPKWKKPKYMDGLTLFFNAYDHIVLPNPLTDVYRALFNELVAVNGSQDNLYDAYSKFFGSALGYVDFIPTVAFKNVNKKTFLMKLENDGLFVLENAKLMHNAYEHKFVLSQAAQAEYEHHNGERIKFDSDILFRKKDVNKLIKQVG